MSSIFHLLILNIWTQNFLFVGPEYLGIPVAELVEVCSGFFIRRGAVRSSCQWQTGCGICSDRPGIWLERCWDIFYSKDSMMQWLLLGNQVMKAVVYLMDGKDLPMRIVTDERTFTREQVNESLIRNRSYWGVVLCEWSLCLNTNNKTQ